MILFMQMLVSCIEDGLATILFAKDSNKVDRPVICWPKSCIWADLLQRGWSNRTILLATGIDWPLAKGTVTTAIFAMDLYYSDDSDNLVQKYEWSIQVSHLPRGLSRLVWAKIISKKSIYGWTQNFSVFGIFTTMCWHKYCLSFCCVDKSLVLAP